jgi:hypothetical protein
MHAGRSFWKSGVALRWGMGVQLTMALAASGCEGEHRPYPRSLLLVEPGDASAAGAPVTAASRDEGAQCEEGRTEPCGPRTSEGVCEFGQRSCTDGEWSECTGAIYPAERDCTSSLDNDCDSQPDNLVDDTCRCTANSSEACETHPGQDGVGGCRAGERLCVVSADRRSSDWGPCEGSMGPATADSCASLGDDANCDGSPNGGCPCVEGTTLPCGPSTDLGICEFGVSRCVNQVRTTCVGASVPAARNCGSDQDNDCNGLADDTVDSVCTCAINDIEVCGEHPGQDGKGPCRAGSRTCVLGLNGTSSRFGECIGSVAALASDLCSVRGDDSNCDGVLNGGCQCITGDTTTCGQLYRSLGVCSSRGLTCGSDGRWPSATSCAPAVPEICNNNLDDDCDGQVNEPDACPQCTPGESLCVDERTSRVCSTSGAFVEQRCPVQCAGGRCVDPVHDSGLIGCNITNQLVCDQDSEQCCQLNGLFTPGTCEPFSVACSTRFAQCDGPSDCPATQVCCYLNNAAVTSLTCRQAADCVDPPPTIPPGRFQALRVVCDPSNPQCPAGSQCLQAGTPFVDMVFFHCTPPGEVP